MKNWRISSASTVSSANFRKHLFVTALSTCLLLSSYINGIDFAIWRAYVDESLLMNENLIEKKELGYGAKIPLSETSFGYLKKSIPFM
jgi:hypothetical protein